MSTSLFAANKTKIAYIVSDTQIPFWNIMSRGVKSKAKELGYEVLLFTNENSNKKELESLAKAIKDAVDAIVLSPISSSSAATLIKIAKRKNIPVVVADIGSENSDYLSYISSNNFIGAYDIGMVLIKKLKERAYVNPTVGIIAIPQNRKNGKERTDGFLKALHHSKIRSADLRQQSSFSCDETYRYTKELIRNNPNMKALWLQGSNRYKAALQASQELGKKDMLLVTFDAEPEFLELIDQEVIVAAAMQQPYLIGQEAVKILNKHFAGKSVPKTLVLPVLAISKDNLESNRALIKKNVLGIE